MSNLSYAKRGMIIGALLVIASLSRTVNLAGVSRTTVPRVMTAYNNLGTGENISLQFTCRNCGGGDRGRVAIYRPFGEVSLSLNRTVTCMVLKANDRRTSCPCHDEFRGPRSDYVRQIILIHLYPKFKERFITKLPFNFSLDVKSMKISSEVESPSGVS
ncbi:uncharacterized protein TNCV_1832511 [Trichonephila clavipes]|nr:uncharacterized protein TNCV_1832511 [Trichonephila clavipes]